MTPREFGDLASELTDKQKLEVVRLLAIVVSQPEARSVIKDCSERGLDIDATLAELSRRLRLTDS